MPAIQTETLCNIIMPVAPDHLRQTGIRTTEFSVLAVFNACFIFLLRIKIISTAEIILGTGSVDSRELGIAIHKKFDLTFAPPAIFVGAISHIRTHVLP